LKSEIFHFIPDIISTRFDSEDPLFMSKPELVTSNTENIKWQIEEAINVGTYLPGDTLDEAALARQFGVSRTPVREAILQLSAQGLVKIVPRSGIHVARMSIKELLAMFELLAELEGACAKLAARRMDLPQRQRLKQIHEESRVFVETHDSENYEKANASFHGLLYEASLNRYLEEQILMIRKRTRAYRQDHFRMPRRLEKSWGDHGRIMEAILACDAQAASQAMIDHIAIGGQEFAEFVTRIPEALLEH
jgi:DNA-binding GntR family transcriptional regulator